MSQWTYFLFAVLVATVNCQGFSGDQADLDEAFKNFEKSFEEAESIRQMGMTEIGRFDLAEQGNSKENDIETVNAGIVGNQYNSFKIVKDLQEEVHQFQRTQGKEMGVIRDTGLVEQEQPRELIKARKAEIKDGIDKAHRLLEDEYRAYNFESCMNNFSVSTSSILSQFESNVSYCPMGIQLAAGLSLSATNFKKSAYVDYLLQKINYLNSCKTLQCSNKIRKEFYERLRKAENDMKEEFQKYHRFFEEKSIDDCIKANTLNQDFSELINKEVNAFRNCMGVMTNKVE